MEAIAWTIFGVAALVAAIMVAISVTAQLPEVHLRWTILAAPTLEPNQPCAPVRALAPDSDEFAEEAESR